MCHTSSTRYHVLVACTVTSCQTCMQTLLVEASMTLQQAILSATISTTPCHPITQSLALPPHLDTRMESTSRPPRAICLHYHQRPATRSTTTLRHHHKHHLIPTASSCWFNQTASTSPTKCPSSPLSTLPHSHIFHRYPPSASPSRRPSSPASSSSSPASCSTRPRSLSHHRLSYPPWTPTTNAACATKSQ